MSKVSFVSLRKSLHRNPELSNMEVETAGRIRALFEGYGPDRVVTGLGGTGLAFEFRGRQDGPTTLIRCELDALPINEGHRVAHRSEKENVSHLCGHDGHMAIVAAVGAEMAKSRPARGRVVLLYQPAEETGDGARQVVKDPQFAEIAPDYAFALHNVPGLPLGQVATLPGPFSCASRGLTVHLRGKPSHAAHPEDGTSPATAMCRVLEGFTRLPRELQGFNRITPVHARLGDPGFGTAPGDAWVMATLRTRNDQEMENLVASACALAKAEAVVNGLGIGFEWEDVFRATVNTEQGYKAVAEACRSTDVDFATLEEGFLWSEDFGALLAQAREGAMFALGSGTDSPQLHTPDYDFPDRLIPIGAAVFTALVEQINGRA